MRWRCCGRCPASPSARRVRSTSRSLAVVVLGEDIDIDPLLCTEGADRWGRRAKGRPRVSAAKMAPPHTLRQDVNRAYTHLQVPFTALRESFADRRFWSRRSPSSTASDEKQHSRRPVAARHGPVAPPTLYVCKRRARGAFG